METKKTWGGKREGAGRKKKYVKMYYFNATQEVHNILQAYEGDRAEFINRCILQSVDK